MLRVFNGCVCVVFWCVNNRKLTMRRHQPWTTPSCCRSGQSNRLSLGEGVWSRWEGGRHCSNKGLMSLCVRVPPAPQGGPDRPVRHLPQWGWVLPVVRGETDRDSLFRLLPPFAKPLPLSCSLPPAAGRAAPAGGTTGPGSEGSLQLAGLDGDPWSDSGAQPAPSMSLSPAAPGHQGEGSWAGWLDRVKAGRQRVYLIPWYFSGWTSIFDMYYFFVILNSN